MLKRLQSKSTRWVYFVIITVFLMCCTGLRLQPVWAQTSDSERPKIGIALGGGGALGLSHIGVLKWLEENRIPVDYVAGTSMGGLIGGCYATGMSADEIETFLKTIDWSQLFDSVPPLKNVDFRRKEDRRDYSAELEMGFKKNSLKLPQGLSGYRISLLLSRITFPYSSIVSFDDLPIPFRCVAADIINNEPVVMGDGSLAEAMRATMAVPSVFTPVERDGRQLVDGGIYDNVPTSVIQKMGANVIIAVHLNANKGKPSGSKGSIVLLNTLDAIIENNSRKSLGIADVVIEPQRGKLNAISWKAIDQFISYGYQAAAAEASRLKKYSLSEEEWQKYLNQRDQRKRTIRSVPEQIMVFGASPQNKMAIKDRLQTYLGKPLDPERLEADLTDIMGTSLYESLRYEFKDQNGISTLVINAIEKPYGPPFIDFALNIKIGDKQSEINPRFRITAFNIKGTGAELRTDIGVGSENYLFSELYTPLFKSNFFLAPFVKTDQTNLTMYDRDGYSINSYQNDHSEIGLDGGYSFGKNAELRIGYTAGYQTLRRQSGEDMALDLDGEIRRTHLQWGFNNNDEMIFAKKGLDWKLEANWYDCVPGNRDSFGQVETQFIKCLPVGAKDMIFMMFAGGGSFQGTPPWTQQFRLGGPFRLGSYSINELSGNNYLLGNVGYLKSLGELPISSRDVYLGLWYEKGGVFDNGSPQVHELHLESDIAIGLLSTTIFGPIYIGYSYGENGNESFNITLGHLF
jgi:NTE family protein